MHLRFGPWAQSLCSRDLAFRVRRHAKLLCCRGLHRERFCRTTCAKSAEVWYFGVACCARKGRSASLSRHPPRSSAIRCATRARASHGPAAKLLCTSARARATERRSSARQFDFHPMNCPLCPPPAGGWEAGCAAVDGNVCLGYARAPRKHGARWAVKHPSRAQHVKCFPRAQIRRPLTLPPIPTHPQARSKLGQGPDWRQDSGTPPAAALERLGRRICSALLRH